MKRLLAVVAISTTVSASAHAEDVWIHVRESVIRSQPMYFAPAVATVRFGEHLQGLSSEKGWMKVRMSGREGYLPMSAITAQQVVLSGRTVTKIEADSPDVVLAGKGFSKEVEDAYKQSDPQARFDLVDKLERQTVVAPKDVQAFIKAGGLKG